MNPYRHPNAQYVFADTRPFVLGYDGRSYRQIVVLSIGLADLGPVLYCAN